MEITGVGKSPNSLSFRYNANNEELEELCFPVCEDDPPTPQCDPPASQSENASPKRGERSSSIIDKYFKSIRTEKVPPTEKSEEAKSVDVKVVEEQKTATVSKEASSSPMKEYLNRLGKRSTSESTPEVKEGSNETWKFIHDFKFKIAQAVEDMKTRSSEETKEKIVPRENSTSDSEESSAIKDLDQHSVGDTDNQVSSLDSSMQNLSEMTSPLTAKATERESSPAVDNKNYSDSSDDTHKNLVYDRSAEVTRDILNDTNLMEVESGIEAFEDTIDGYGDIQNLDTQSHRSNSEGGQVQPPPSPNNFGFPPNRNNIKEPKKTDEPKHYFFNFPMYFLTFLIFVNYILFPNSNIWNGFLLGLWFFCFWNNLKSYLMDTFFIDSYQKPSVIELKRTNASPQSYTIPVVKEHKPLKKYEGWINHYRYPDYDPFSYHINKTTTAFMKLEGCNLRISYTTTKIAKRALWDEKIERVAFYQHRLYNLTGSKLLLLPQGLVRRRQWSKKYPICVILSEKESIQVLEKETSNLEKKSTESPTENKKKEQHEMETETNVSPEKKKKFVWRRREKSIASHPDAEPGKEGLRHRLVRKMHRDKKTDNVTAATGTEPAETQNQNTVQTDLVFLDENHHDGDLVSKSNTSTKDEIDEELDDTDICKIKDLLEETEREPGLDGTDEGEWSVHVRRSDKHSHLYLFARTGRDKHEWYRRLAIAITEANTSPESSTTEEKSSNAATTGEREGIEMTVYKVSEKDTVAFAKSSTKTDVSEGGVTITSISPPVPGPENYEKTFWPYLLKIIQSKSGQNACTCRSLPAEVTWVNTLVARVMYDLMRDPIMIQRLQDRIQRKINTLKLPSFMSPLVVTELSLAGACPLVECVASPGWDARGVWLDADVRYDGGAYIAVLTQINLLKLKEKNVTLEEQILTAQRVDTDRPPLSALFTEKNLRSSKPAIYESDVEDSAESSSDDENPLVQPIDSEENFSFTDPVVQTSQPEQGGSSKKKFLRMVDKIATNKYFQQVTDYKYVKRAMEGLSNTDIKVHIEVHGLEGRVAFNLPAPPHDRLWIGFRTNPQLVLKARPAVGARTLRFAHISNWIEQKLSKEFEKILVLPNMEDIIIDILTPTPVHFE